MKSFVLLLVLLFTQTIADAQSVQWAQRIGNIKSDKITSVKTDGQGYIYIAGYFSTSITIGTNAVVLNFVANQQSKEAFIAKLDSTGFCYWAKSGGQYFDDRVLGMDVDSAGYAVITGTYWEGSGINFPPGVNVTASSVGSGDQCFIVRFDPSGTPLWGRYVCSQSYGDDQGLDIAMDKFGNIYTVGFMTNQTLVCSGGTVTATNPNIGQHKHCYWITKMNSAGVFQWARTFGNLPWDPAHFKYIERDIAVCTDNQDGIYITGGFDSTRHFGTNTFTSAGGYDVFVMKYDSSGNFKWATQAGSDKDDWSNGICHDKNGHVYITGEHRDSLIMDTVLVKNYDKRDVFVFKIDDQTGKPLWGKRAGGDNGSERGNDIWADDNCNVYVCGDINEDAKFGDNIHIPVTGLGVQGFLARISPEGKWSWAVTGGGLGDEDRGNALAKGKANQVYMGGFFRVGATYGSAALVSAGSSDGMFIRVHDSMLNKGSQFVLNPPNKTILCFGDTAHLSIPDHAGLNVSPTTGIQFNSDSTELVFSPSATTSYTIDGFSAGACGTYDTMTFTIQVGLEAFSLTEPTDKSICPGETIVMSIVPHDHFEVNPPSGTVLNTDESLLSFSPLVTTAYTISGYHLGPCPTYDTVAMTIVVNPKPVAQFQVTPEVVFLEAPTFTLQNNSTGADHYKWYDGSHQLFSTTTSPVVTESALGTYCFTLVAETIEGCVDSATNCGDVVNNEKVFFPTAFSPNGDSRNDFFKPVFEDVDLGSMKDYSLIIANRYGEVMFKSFSPTAGWNGTWGGVKCDLGTYYFHCKFTTPQGKVYNVKGDVSLIY